MQPPPPHPISELPQESFGKGIRPVACAGGGQGPKPPDADASLALLQTLITERGECRYLKKKLLGSGAYGTAWLVEEVGTEKLYAAKSIDVSAMNAKARGFVANEVKCLACCHHPNIVRHIVTTEMDGMMLIVMEFADGGDLHKQIKLRSQSRRYFREHEVVFLFLQLCLALHHIHSQKMMHRDLKSANVLLTSTGLVKLGDFGFSRQYEDSLSKPVGSTFCGTPYYLSPELWRRAPYSKKSELWALGVILFELIALDRPFGGKTMDDLIKNILGGDYGPLPPQTSPELSGIVARLLCVDPAKRVSLEELFRDEYIRAGLVALRRGVEAHERIPPQVRAEVAAAVEVALAVPALPPVHRPLSPFSGPLYVHLGPEGWCPCDVRASLDAIVIRLGDGSEENIPAHTVSSVCPVDAAIAGEALVFGIKTVTGRAYWLKDATADSFQQWLNRLQGLVADM